MFMLFWREKIKIRENILMIYFIFYLYYLNDKENGLKLSIYKKIQFPLGLGILIPTCFKRNHIPTDRGLRGESRFPWHLIL